MRGCLIGEVEQRESPGAEPCRLSELRNGTAITSVANSRPATEITAPGVRLASSLMVDGSGTTVSAREDALMTDKPWTAEDIPDQRGRTAVVTGANTGLGFEAARLLTERGASVVLACRTPTKAEHAAERLRALVPGSAVTTLRLDQSSQASVREAAARLHATHERVDLLVNNAGTLGSTQRTVTKDGSEATFATNHLGVFAFTGLVLDLLLRAPSSRVVTVSSLTHRFAALDLDDLQSERRYSRDKAYGRSKLANVLFTYELQRRLAAADAETIAVAAHPGQSRTDFTRDLNPVARFIYGPHARPLTGWMLQDRAVGVLSEVRAAVDPDVQGAEYYGPSGPLQLTGHPVRNKSSRRSYDQALQQRLWHESERLTGVTYDFPANAR